MSTMTQISKLKQPPSDVRYVVLTANLNIEAELIAYLESEAQRRKTSLDGLLEQIASEYAANKRRYKSRTGRYKSRTAQKKSGTSTSQ